MNIALTIVREYNDTALWCVLIAGLIIIAVEMKKRIGK
jgi:hypothetical protein